LRILQLHPRREVWAFLLGICICSHLARAQRIESGLELGGVAIRYADSLNGVAATLSPELLADWGNRVADVSGTYSQFGSDWSLQGQASGSLFIPTRSLVSELAGFAGGSTHRDGSHTGELLINARLHAQYRLAELFIGAGAGQTTFGNESRTLLLGEAGISRSVSDGAATFTITPVAMGDSIRYADTQASFSLRSGRIDFGALAGARFGDQLKSLGGGARAWGNLSVTSWLTSRAGVVLSGGSYPIDPTQGFPGGRFISLGLRISSARRPVRVANSDSAVALEAAAVRFEFERHGGVVTFRVQAPLAANVELAGDFTNWEPVQMAPAGNGWWTLSRELNLGKYQINLRINGGKWVVPPGLLAMLDEFGGSVGLLVVE
jgi:Carbohydrate-binding module 48 (Isoamylase N-terminal domain)